MEELNSFLINAPFMVNALNPIVSKKLNENDDSNTNIISCILWYDKNAKSCDFFITGTDIIKILIFKFETIGRPIKNMKKFEEGVYSDLRQNFGVLENAKSEFLTFLYKNSCLRTLKKQKVFFWEDIDHNRLFLRALNRDLERESKGLTTFSIPTLNYCPDKILCKIGLGNS